MPSRCRYWRLDRCQRDIHWAGRGAWWRLGLSLKKIRERNEEKRLEFAQTQYHKYWNVVRNLKRKLFFHDTEYGTWKNFTEFGVMKRENGLVSSSCAWWNLIYAMWSMLRIFFTSKVTFMRHNFALVLMPLSAIQC